MKTHLNYLIIAGCLVMQGLAQDASFSNTNQSPIYLNPSFAGSNQKARLQTYYNNEFPASSRRAVNYFASFDTYIKKTNGGFMASLFTDDLSRERLKPELPALAMRSIFPLPMTGSGYLLPSRQALYNEGWTCQVLVSGS